MSWSADWRIPRPRLGPAELRELLERHVLSLAGGKLAYLHEGSGGSAYANAGIELDGRDGRRYLGCLEWWFDEPTELLDSEWNRARIDEALGLEDDEDDDDDEGALVPCGYCNVANARHREVDVLGYGRAIVTLTGERDARLTPVISNDTYKPARLEELALLGMCTAAGTRWAWGGPNLLYRQHGREPWTRVATGLEGELAITGVHPISADSCWAITDSGSVWQIAAGRAERLDAIPDTDSYDGMLQPNWSLANRHDEVWVANGTSSIYRISGDARVAAIDLDTTIEWLAIDLGGSLWAGNSDEIYRGDGQRFEQVHEMPCNERHLRIQTVGSSHGCTFAVAASYQSPQPQLLLFDATGYREVELPSSMHYVHGAALTRERTLWVTGNDLVTRFDLPGPPHTRLTVRSSRNDNREDACWEAICTLAARIADDLGGWSEDRG